MIAFKVIILSLFFGHILSDKGSLLKACNSQDLECLRKSSEQFLESTYNGIPAHDIKPIDPMIINSIDYVVHDGVGLLAHYKNVNITGLKNQEISEFRMDKSTKSVMLATKTDVNVVADIVIEFSKKSKSFSGTYTAKGSVLNTALYNYNLRTDDKGVEHFDVGPETITCKVVAEPQVVLNSELGQALNSDPEVKQTRDSLKDKELELKQNAFCKIIEVAMGTVIHNIRASAKALPKTAFFNDV